MKKRFVFASLFLIFLSFAVLNFSYNNKTVKLISPVVNRANVLGINQWFPGILKGEQAAIRISAKAALFTETKNGEVLYGKNIEGKLPIAEFFWDLPTMLPSLLRNSQQAAGQNSSDL